MNQWSSMAFQRLLGLGTGILVLFIGQLVLSVVGLPQQVAHLVAFFAGAVCFYKVGRMKPWWLR